MSKEIITEITIHGNAIKHFNSITINQEFNSHHSFELVVDQDSLEELGGHTIDKSQQYIGKFITICFGEKDSGDNIFKGLITEVGLEQDEGLWGSLVLKGFSPTILMESGGHYNSYEKFTLKDLFEISSKNIAGNDLVIENNPAFKQQIPYMCQYGESFFGFINRLACEYGEWFFCDGNRLYFGRPKKMEQVDMIYGEHISKMYFAMKLQPSKISHYSYSSKEDNVLTADLPKNVTSPNEYIRTALDVSDKLYRSTVQQPIAIRVSNQGDMENYTKIQKEKLAASTVQLNGEGDNAKVKLGCIIKIKVSKKGIGIGYEEHGEYVVTKVTHHISGTGAYNNSFSALPSTVEVMPYNTVKPVGETQIATVKDNNDPTGQGRVRVQMIWQKKENQMTDWIRVLTPDAGSSDSVSKNRGFVFIPEVGDQVVVGFRYNDPNRPFVIGSMFHGKSGGGGGSGNNAKSLTTRGGSTIVLDESKNSITISDPSGNTISMDGAKNISIKSTTSIVLESETIILKGKKIGISAEDSLVAAGKKTMISGSSELTAGGGKALIGADSELTLASKKVNVSGDSQLALSGKTVNVSGTADVGISGAIVKINS